MDGETALCVERVLYAMMISSPNFAEQQWAFTRSIQTGPTVSADNRRIWWRVPHFDFAPAGWQPGYVSLSPGEYRAELPPGCPDAVFDPPEDSEHPRLTELLRDFLGDDGSSKESKSKQSDWLEDRARAVLREFGTNLNLSAAAKFRTILEPLRQGEPRNVKEEIDKLYQMFLRFEIPGEYFHAGIAAFELQLSPGFAATEDVWDDPDRAVKALINTGTVTPGFREAAIKVGNGHFEAAEKLAEKALSSVTRRSFYRRLFLAAHHAMTALCIAGQVENVFGKDVLDYRSLMSEELFACTSMGLMFHLEDASTEEFEKHLAKLLKFDPPAAERAIKGVTWIKDPVYSRHEARYIMSKALFRAGKHEESISALNKSIEDLNTQCGPTEVGFVDELNRLELSLVRVYKDLGDRDATEKYARRVAARMIVERLSGDAS